MKAQLLRHAKDAAAGLKSGHRQILKGSAIMMIRSLFLISWRAAGIEQEAQGASRSAGHVEQH
ncbi:hypothetical protein NGR_c18300 [Sinorhizobium fredii NGR234]|uniref:Uncharacterized protein n=1 Tax=Sinorhizobium fredii (strain NBRC 101917 / NGR234) TaxID=394 RepID=C3MDS5_SINFN|nr:hypothetical protein NGR_c18300 [Sinorhizobium fredii NGR234]